VLASPVAELVTKAEVVDGANLETLENVWMYSNRRVIPFTFTHANLLLLHLPKNADSMEVLSLVACS